MMEKYLHAHVCVDGCQCDFVNHSLEKRISEFSHLGAVPHCFFMEMSQQTVVVAERFSDSSVFDLYASTCAFYEREDSSTAHAHASFHQLCSRLRHRPEIILHASGGAMAKISAAEAAKLIEQTNNVSIANDAARCEDIELKDGQQMIFSSPDPEIPQDFINFLTVAFSPIKEVAEVYAFETTAIGQVQANLVVGVVPSRNLSRHEADHLSLLIVEGVEQFLADRELIDFMVIEDEQLREIAVSVSPVIKLER